MPDAESQPSRPDDESIKPEVVGVLRFELSGLALGPDYPATTISAEIGRVAIAAARVDQEYALLLSGLHAGERADWDFEDLRRSSSAWLREKSLDRVEELFEGQLLEHAQAVVRAAYTALDHRHVAMHNVWTLTGPDAITPAADLVAALESSDPDAALATLVGRDVDSKGWSIVHPRTGGPGPASVAELRGIRRELEHAKDSLIELRFRLASALYAGKPPGARAGLLTLTPASRWPDQQEPGARRAPPPRPSGQLVSAARRQRATVPEADGSTAIDQRRSDAAQTAPPDVSL